MSRRASLPTALARSASSCPSPMPQARSFSESARWPSAGLEHTPFAGRRQTPLMRTGIHLVFAATGATVAAFGPFDACRVEYLLMDALKQQIVQRLPYLRRYARALTGSQTVGDQYIRGCLETLLQEPTAIKATGNLPVQLFRMFHRFADTVQTYTEHIVTCLIRSGVR